ncbi:MAG: hypothetical protein ABDH29_04185 [Aquificaceae bacterium]
MPETIRNFLTAILRVSVGFIRILFGYSGQQGGNLWQTINTFLSNPCAVEGGLFDFILNPMVAEFVSYVLLIFAIYYLGTYFLRAYLAPFNAVVIYLISNLRRIMRGHQKTGMEATPGDTEAKPYTFNLSTGLLLFLAAILMQTSEGQVLAAIGNVLSGLLTLGSLAVLNIVSMALLGHPVCAGG